MTFDKWFESTDLAALSEAIHAACGPLAVEAPEEDPRYGAGFVDIKQEIDKLRDGDLERVVNDSLAFLHREAKDLRIGGYLSMALVARHGALGLLAAVIVYRHLLEVPDEGLFPKRPAQRRSAIAWLNSPRMEVLLDAVEPDLSAPLWQELYEHLENVDRLCRERFPSEEDSPAPTWTAALAWAEKHRRREEPDGAPEPQGAEPPPKRDEPGRAAAPEAHSLSREERLARMRVLHDAVLDDGFFIQAAAIARAARWGTLEEPPAADRVTRIPPPRENAWQELRVAERKSDKTDAYRVGARLMFEPGFQWSVDLQQWLAGIAAAISAPDLQAFIEGEMVLLAQRVPGIVSLQFADGRPFASDAARAWLAGLGQGTTRTSDESEVRAEDDFGAQLAAVRQEPDLDRAFRLLEAVPARTTAQRCRVDLLRAERCLEASRPRIAYALLLDLKRRVEATTAAEWDPEVGVRVYEALRRAGMSLKPGRGDRTQVGQMIEECERSIAGLSPARALQLA